MISNIIIKIRKGFGLEDHEQELLDHVIASPNHPEYVELYLAGLV